MFIVAYFPTKRKEDFIMSKNEIIDTTFIAQCKLELIKIVIETLNNKE